ncbi:hypothetical protein GOP47_0015108 [Adiantum capillus-veneris]|uniref:VQ domain-containing protein n=1 Tax=Adiantum capillus-veneris TaxID=13818 RepID=A0A9D4ZEW3_ADICA|nr:hypothetical protein GOP47_0015108 [Adiantum capillus-veneris]
MRKLKQRPKPPALGITRQESKNDTQSLAMAPHKQPLIIHTFSPEVIHAEAYNFMNLVQRLTGRASHVSPPSKRPRYAPNCVLLTSPGMRHVSVPSELQCGASSHYPLLPPPTYPASLPKTPLPLQQEQQRSISELASRRGLSPRVRLGLKLQTDLSPHSRAGAGIHDGALVRSPMVFEFSPSMLPTPPAMLHQFPSLSPYADVAGLLSPRVTRVGAVARSPMIMPSILPSPGPLTSAFLVDLPALSPAAHSWLHKPPLSTELASILPSPGPLTSAFLVDLPALSPAAHSWLDKHPLSTELVLSPLSRGFGLTPRRPPWHEKSLV